MKLPWFGQQSVSPICQLSHTTIKMSIITIKCQRANSVMLKGEDISPPIITQHAGQNQPLRTRLEHMNKEEA